ncbi:MAG: ParB/RepB/Spo0J family partition protein [Planctomycetia bacterium]|nr:ParB/RepB/Spo0J family partition protein [Planctomycetia bacterium]
MSKERRLGRGLGALLGRAGVDPAPVAHGTAAVVTQPARQELGAGAARLILHKPEELEQAAATLPTNEIAEGLIDPNPWQPRSIVNDTDLVELSNSLREHGLVQPVVVRAHGDRYQLIAGQRRLFAARRLGWGKVPVRVLEVDDRQMSEIAIVENLQRRDLDPLEKAASFKQYLSAWGGTQDELAKRLSIDRSTVANLIRLLELPEAVQKRLRSGAISMGHARALLPLGDEEEQARLADRIASDGLSVRAIEAEVAEILRADDMADEDGMLDDTVDQPLGGGTATTAGTAVKRKPGRPATKRSSQTVAVENDLRRALGVKVVVHANGKGAGRIVIPFANLDEFQRLFEHLAE